MPGQPRTDLDTGADQVDRESFIQDLESRIDELEALDASDVGNFTRLDWFFCIAGSIVLPAIALWWFSG